MTLADLRILHQNYEITRYTDPRVSEYFCIGLQEHCTTFFLPSFLCYLILESPRIFSFSRSFRVLRNIGWNCEMVGPRRNKRSPINERSLITRTLGIIRGLAYVKGACTLPRAAWLPNSRRIAQVEVNLIRTEGKLGSIGGWERGSSESKGASIDGAQRTKLICKRGDKSPSVNR